MSLPTGLAAQLGFVPETTYGTYAVPTVFPEFVSESMKLNIQRMESKGIRAGQSIARSNRRVLNRKGAGGDLVFEVAGEGFGKLFKHMGFATVAAPVAAGTGYQQSLTLGDANGLSMTIQVGRPGVGGTIRPYSYLGSVFTDWEFTCDVDDFLMLKLGVDSRDESTADALATASVPEAELLTYLGGVITVDGSAVDVTKFSLKGERKLKDDRYFVNGSSLKKAPLLNDLMAIGGSIEIEHDDLDLYDVYRSGADVAFTATFTGPEYDTGFPFKVDITIPAIQIDGDTPNVEGADVVMQTVPFTVVDNGTDEPITLDYYTTDATI